MPDSTPLSLQTRFLVSPICIDAIFGMPFLSSAVKHVNWATGVICLDNGKGHDRTVQMVRDARPHYFPQSTAPVTDTVQPFASLPAMSSLLHECAYLFRPPSAIPTSRSIEHAIILRPEADLPLQRCRRFAPPEMDVIRKEIDSLLAQGKIRESKAPFAANMLIVGKKDGTKRVCVDYRQLNAVTIPDVFPVPHISDSLLCLCDAPINLISLLLHTSFYLFGNVTLQYHHH